ncbi:hypothetical protein BDY19DRAFT_923486 [Irpex rosettiformis]|uniref:Uncharacterized protein n=1 Tax=Irpex rosettiformis TaxID=378272 RepID=A0ACB8UGB8_9APHY|nr:hypothetical protein BDY19DRAFT_923486 [Irpex rosettiformis]
MLNKSSSVNNRLVEPGIYEIQSGVTSLFLNSTADAVYNGWCDDALTLKRFPSRRGKWEITKVGDGYTIKQVFSGMYCALVDGDRFLSQPVVLSKIPTIWAIDYLDESSEKARILWSASEIAWEMIQANNLKDTLLAMGNLSSSNVNEKPKEAFVWNLKLVGESTARPGLVMPGLYSLQNKVSQTFVMMGPNGILGCWPKAAFVNENTKLWEIAPLGDGYTIRFCGTDMYCTLEDIVGDQYGRLPINLSTYPGIWKIDLAESILHEFAGCFQIFWGETRITWDLNDGGSAKAGTLVTMKNYGQSFHPCRLFKFIP